MMWTELVRIDKSLCRHRCWPCPCPRRNIPETPTKSSAQSTAWAYPVPLNSSVSLGSLLVGSWKHYCRCDTTVFHSSSSLQKHPVVMRTDPEEKLLVLIELSLTCLLFETGSVGSNSWSPLLQSTRIRGTHHQACCELS
jgi:hypothetical protein